MLEAIDLAVCYDEREVLGGVSFQLRSSELLTIVGPNGSGKSTLIRALTGYAPSSRGRVLLENIPLAKISSKVRASKIAVVPQTTAIPFAFTVREVVEMGRYHARNLLDSMKREDREAVDWALNITDTRSLQDRRADSLSGGELQRVILARALAQKTRIILMDEPTTFLDLGHEIEFFELISNLCRECEIGILCVSHDLNFAAEYSDKIMLLHEGKVVCEGTPGEVITEKNLADYYHADVAIESNTYSHKPQVVIKRIATPRP